MQREQLCPCSLQLFAPEHGICITSTPSQPRLHGDGHCHCTRYCFHDSYGQFGITDQPGTAALARNFPYRAPHVDVDQEGSTGFSSPCGIGNGLGAMVKQLNTDGARFVGE